MSRLPPFLDLPPAPEEPRRPKSWKLAVLLTVLFGPLGLFYVSRPGGALMSFVTLVAGIGTMGIALFFAWPVCILWAYVVAAASEMDPHGSGPPEGPARGPSTGQTGSA